MILLGELALWTALLMAAWATIAAAAGARWARAELVESATRATIAVPLLLAAAVAGLWTALLGHDFSLRQVAEHSSLATPWPYRLAALWAGVGGALLLWAVALATHGAVLAVVLRRRARQLAPLALAVMGALTLALLAVLLFAAYPYARLEWPLPDGRGLIPELQHPAMALHPPLLHFGYAAAGPAFALAVAALLHRATSTMWMPLVRAWASAAWALLTASILLGMRWALVTPGWEGLWQWEPVQVMALVAWLVAGILVHGGIAERRWPVLQGESTWFAALWFPLALLGLAAAHAGESGGRHAFRDSPAQAPLVLLVLAAFAAAFALLAWRGRRQLAEAEAAHETGRPGGRTRNVGALLAHAGAVLLVVALGAHAATRTYRVRLDPAQTVELTDPFGGVWSFTSLGVSRDRVAGSEATSLGLELARNGRAAGLLVPEVRQHASPDGAELGRAMPTVATRTTPAMEVAVMLAGPPEGGAPLVIAFHPLAALVWVGGGLVVVGSLAASFRGRR